MREPHNDTSTKGRRAVGEIRIAFTMDEPYFREFFDEWVAVVGRGWRVDRVMIPTFGLVGVGGCIAAAVFGVRPMFASTRRRYRANSRPLARWMCKLLCHVSYSSLTVSLPRSAMRDGAAPHGYHAEARANVVRAPWIACSYVC